MLSDLRYSSRQLAKNSGFTAVVVLSLALGIGANTTVLCWLQNLVLRPLPGVSRQEEIVVVLSNQGGGNVSVLDLQDVAALPDLFAGAAASQTSSAALTVDQSLTWIDGQVVSANFFNLLGVSPILGRTFLPDEDQKPGGNPVLVISERLWRGQFKAEPSIIGRVVDLNRQSFTIIGVVPEEFHGTMTPSDFDFWAPLSMGYEVRRQALSTTNRQVRGWHNFARLRPGVSVANTQAAVAALDRNLAATYPNTNRDIHHRVLPYSQCPWGSQALMGPVLRLLLVVSLGVLLIVAANVANLLLARATGRRKEIAIRLAAGASRWRLVRQLMTESLLLAVLGGALGTLLASWAINCIPYFLPKLPAGVSVTFSLDAPTLGLTLLLTLATGLVFGLLPAWQTTRVDLNETLKQNGRSAAGASHHRMRNGLVIAEVALALVLLICAGLCLKGLKHAQLVDTGIDPSRVLIGRLQIGMNGYTRETGKLFYHDLQQRLAALPGVEEAALASWFPLGLSGCKGWNAYVEGYERPPNEDLTYEYAIVSPRYFATLAVPLIAGRDFTDADDSSAPTVAIVNEAFAQRFWPGQDPLGRRFRTGSTWRTIVGVTKTGKYNQLNEPARCFFYLPYLQGVPDLDLNICLRTSGDPAAFANTLTHAVHEIDPGVSLLRVIPMSETILASFTQRMAASLLMLLGCVALILAAMGVYAVMAYAVSQRTQEFGVRMALGAQPGAVLRQVVGQGLVLAAIGTGAGLLLAFSVTRLLAGFLYGVSPFDPAIFLGVPSLLIAVGALACWLPARRATRVNPIEALRTE
ncbi:MAG: ABC transporter permease [Verrucomicrobia bacterium]|nr:ABC transporter permease [Verrucomicrobiota bacterium]